MQTQWKCANTIAVPKTSKPKDPNDYRPISLASTLWKVFEKIISMRRILKVESMPARTLKIIGINSAKDRQAHGVSSIEKMIDKQCNLTLNYHSFVKE